MNHHESVLQQPSGSWRRPMTMWSVTWLLLSPVMQAAAGSLPVPCAAGSCGPTGPSVWVSSGKATASQAGNALTINQQSNQAIFNWASFDVDAASSVIFKQPSATSIALNRIFQSDPTHIFGTLSANGQVYLVNQNGIIFGPHSRVNVNSLIATTLTISDKVFSNGILSSDLLGNDQAAFNAALDADGKAVSGDILVNAGAQISTPQQGGGRIVLLGQNVDNSGTLTSPNGQVILAAGQKAYFQASDDVKLRGLVVEVDGGGSVWNRLSGSISSSTGNVTLLGLAVNQDGRVSATTSVAANGSITLRAADTHSISFVTGTNPHSVVNATNGGTLELGADSVTSVLPDTDILDKAVDAQVQNPSTISLVGRNVHLAGGSEVIAKGGEISVIATQNPSLAQSGGVLPVDPSSQLRIDAGARIDASGSDATLPMSANIVTAQLRGNELRDSPQQRDGALRGQTVYVDARVGTTLGDVQGSIDAVPRSIEERTSAGGKILIQSEGDAVLAQGATLDVSGGRISYTGGVIATTQLVTADGRIVDIGTADPNLTYSGLINPTVDVTHFKWGVIDNFALQGSAHYEAGYDEGRDAGTVQIAGRSLVVNGTLLGQTYSGPYQRDAAHRPLGGQLIIGVEDADADFFAPSVEFRRGILPISVAPGTALTGLLSTLTLSTDYLTDGGFTRTVIRSNGRISVPAGLPLELSPFSSFDLQAPRIELNSDISAPGGALTFTSLLPTDPTVLGYQSRPGVLVGSGVSMDVSGRWINDYPTLAGIDPVDPLAFNGGSIAVNVSSAAGELVVRDGVHMDVSAGAYVNAAGSTTNGNAGSLGIAATAEGSAIDIGANLNLAGYGINGGQGGSLRIIANRVEIDHSADPWPAQRIDFSDPSALSLRLSDSLFTQGGFSRFTIAANGPTAGDATTGIVQPLVIDGAADIHAQVLTRFVPGDALYTRSTGSAIGAFATAVLPPDYLRVRSDLNFSLYSLGSSNSVNPTNAGDLVVQSGAMIRTDADSSISFNSLTNLRFAGTAIAPSGSISLKLDNPAVKFDAGYDAEQGIYLEPGSRLDVSGVTVYSPSSAGLRVGQVLDGGTVSISANRGSVFAQAGSSIDVSGTQAVLDLADPNANGSFVATNVASAGGSIAITAPESIVLDSTLAGRAGNFAGDAGPSGGSLSLTLSRNTGYVAPLPDANVPPVPTSPRTLLVSAFPQSNQDVSAVNPLLIKEAGFDSLALAADDQIQLAAGVPISFDRSLSLQAPNLAVFGSGTVDIQAPVVKLGPVNSATQATTAAEGGVSTLSVKADLIELDGNVSLHGFGHTQLNSTQEIRAAGVLTGQQLVGSLSASGDLQMTAREIYPTTLTQYTFSVPGGSIETHAAGAAQPVLSAGGSLTLSAADIVHDGSIEAPFGHIALNADNSLVMGAGSLVSTSGRDQIIPFGNTENGTAWIYSLDDSLPIKILAPPDKRVSLTAPSVDIKTGATVDISGGGDLYAYEFLPGLGGSKDVLSPSVTPGAFAIVPRLSGYAAFDTQYYAGSGIGTGDAVYLSGIPGELDAGTYAILPARYALLPGAFLVTPVNAQQDLAPGQVASSADGTPIVSGYRTILNTGIRDSRTSGFAVRPGSDAHQLAQYDDTFANLFFAADAKTREALVPALPMDAGALSLNVIDKLILDGIISTQATSGGRGAVVDLSAQNLRIVTQPTAASGVVQVSASSLEALGAQSLLIGGSRSTAADGTTQLSVDAQDVTLAAGTSLTAPEILLVGQDQVTVEQGAKLTASGAATGAGGGAIAVSSTSGSSALLRVSSGNQVELTRESVNAASGTVDIGQNAVILAPGSITLSATRDARSQGALEAGRGSVSLEASLISLGDSAATDQGLVLSNTQLGLLGNLSDLRLISQSTIDFYGTSSLGSLDAQGKATLSSLTLDASALRGFGGDGSVATLTAGDVHLGSALPAAQSDLGSGSGRLAINGDALTLGAGNYGFSGFENVALSSRGDISASGRSVIGSHGNLSLQSTRIIGSGGADVSIDATGYTVRTTTIAADPKLAVATPGLGARFAIDAAQIQQGGDFELPSGTLTLQAAGDVTLGAGSTVNVAGVTRSIGGVPVSTPGGSVSLISTTGNVTAAAQSVVNLSGAGDRNAGSLRVDAAGVAELQGSLRAQAASGAEGGSFQFRAAQLADLSSLAGQLDAAGFSQRQDITADTGNLSLAAGGTLRAHEVALTANGGAVQIDGTIDARGSDGGAVLLAARDAVGLGAAGVIRADASGSSSTGGNVEFVTSSGSLSTAAGSLISVAGAQRGGTVEFRAPGVGNDVAITALDGRINGAGAVIARVVRTYDGVTVADDALKNTVTADLADFSTTAATVAQRLGQGGALPLQVQAGIELRSDGDMTVSAPWDLSTLRPNGLPGELTLRAAGNLTINAGISDGFVDLGEGIVQSTAPSWSYGFVGGADTASANPYATQRTAAIAATSGNLVIGSGAAVRTGTGSIRLNAANDIVFTDATSVVYTAGLPVAERTALVTTAGTFNWSEAGGDIQLNAGRDIVGAVSTQMITDWQLRQAFDRRAPDSRTQWGVDFSKFQENVGALGGGNVTAAAGRDILNFSAVLPTTGYVDPESGTLSVYGAGNLSVSAGRDLSSGVYYVGRGTGDIRVGRTMTAGRDVNGLPFGTVLALGDASFDVTAANGLQLQSVLNPTVIGQSNVTNRRTDFFTYTADSGVDLLALSGSLSLLNSHSTFVQAVNRVVAGNTAGVDVSADVWYPSHVAGAALDGDISLGGAFWMFPSARGNLDLLASDNVNFLSNGSTFAILQSRAEPDRVPTPLNPGTGLSGTVAATLQPNLVTTTLHQEDPDPIRIIAEKGDIVGGLLQFAEPAQLIAGRDILDVSFVGENFHPSDVTLLQAGRDISYAGGGNSSQITLGGPGSLDILAGRNIDLGTSVGITTVGATVNTALSANEGASVNLLAGLAKQPDYQAFVTDYLVKSNDYATNTTEFMRALTGNAELSAAAALAAFQKLPTEQQLPLIFNVFFDELKLAGREANAKKNPGYARGFTAINTLFPGSVNADGTSVTADKLPYQGDLDMAFSRIYTVAGGDINLLVPGGLINVGLAVPPANAPVRQPSELGIVTQGTGSVNAFTYGDVLVNQSRIFTLGGGSIIIWSSTGNIDAGRGAKTAISAPPPILIVKDDGSVSVDFAGAVAGSGIRTILTDPSVKPGDVDLIAPVGTVNAGDAGIGSAGNINIAAQTVVGADNINFGGTATGVPASTSNLAAGLSGVNNTSSSSSSNAAAGAANAGAADKTASVADSALGWLDVFVTGLGDDNCKQDDIECLKRQKRN